MKWWGEFVVLHVVLAIINLYDLATKSRRSSKVSWAILIATIPILGVTIYHLTKRRNSYLRRL